MDLKNIFIIVENDLSTLKPKAFVMPDQVFAGISRGDVLEIQTKTGGTIGVRFSSVEAVTAALRIILWVNPKKGVLINLDGQQIPLAKWRHCNTCDCEAQFPEATESCPLCGAKFLSAKDLEVHPSPPGMHVGRYGGPF